MATTLPRLQGRVKRLSTLLRFVLRQWSREELHTGMPGIVETYDAASRRARVIPGVRALMADGTYMDRPPIVNVPVLFPSFGGVTVEGPLETGAAYWMSVSERGIGMFKDSLKVSDFPKERFFDVGDAVLHAGARFLPDTLAGPAAGAWFGNEDRHIRIHDSGIAIMGDVTVTGDLAVSGELSQDGVDVGSGHKHPKNDTSVPPNPATTGPVFTT